MKFKVTIVLLSFFTYTAIGQPASPDSSKPFVMGRIYELNSTVLKEKRILNISFPYGYSVSDTSRYPVIYLLDGSADEDFIHIAGLVQFYSTPWVKMLPPSILVGICNVDRKRDFTFPTLLEAEKKAFPTSGQSAAFIRFIETELQPFIDKNFKSNGSRTLIGESLGGLLATEILLQHTHLFNQYIIVSPSLWWNDGSLLKLAGEIKTKQPAKIYVGVGKEGLAPSKNYRVMEVDANVLADKLKIFKNYKVLFDYLPQEDHGTIMHQAVLNAIKLFHKN